MKNEDFINKVIKSFILAITLAICWISIMSSTQHLLGMIPETDTNTYMYETLISYTEYQAPYYKFEGKVNHFFEAKYLVCFPFEDKIFCSNNQQVFNANKFDDMWNIVVSVDVLTNKEDGKFVSYENVKVILDY